MAKAVIFFRGTGWTATDALESLALTSTQWFGAATYYRVSTLARAVELASTLDDDLEVTIAPEPPWLDANGNQQSVFFDAAGLPLQRVDVALGSNLTISRALTLAGGAYRLRLDGSGTYYIASIGASFEDCDLVNLNYGSSGYSLFVGANQSTRTLRRCAVINSAATASATLLGCTSSAPVACYDCLFAHCVTTTYLGNGFVSCARCTVYACYTFNGTTTDCVIVRPYSGTDPGVSPANAFVGGASIPDDPSTVTDWSDATNWDFHLLSTSSYATGGTSVTSGSKVYGLDGLPRKVGGALGAYECYSDINRYDYQVYPLSYDIEGDSGALVGLSCTYHNGTMRYLRFTLSEDATAFEYYANTWRTGTMYNHVVTLAVGVLNGNKYRITTPSGTTIITAYNDLTTGANVGSKFNDAYAWRTLSTAHQGINASSVARIDHNNVYADNATAFIRAYVSGWTHVDLGDNGGGAELIIGLGATATSSGSTTIKDETQTDAELWQKLTLESGATLTLDDCATTDAA